MVPLLATVGYTTIAVGLGAMLVTAVLVTAVLGRRLVTLRATERASLLRDAEQAASAMVVSEMKKTVFSLRAQLQDAEDRIAALERALDRGGADVGT